MLKLLLEAGGDPDLADDSGLSPRKLAHNRPKVLEALAAHENPSPAPEPGAGE